MMGVNKMKNIIKQVAKDYNINPLALNRFAKGGRK